MQLGYLYHGLALATNYELKLNDLKRLTLHSLVYPYSVDFGNLETIVYIDILYCTLFTNVRTYNFNSPYPENINIELKKSNRELDLTKNKIECFYIDKNVKVIQTGVFDGVEGVIIRTSYESKPEGWEDGWNGNCQVEWGVNLD